MRAPYTNTLVVIFGLSLVRRTVAEYRGYFETSLSNSLHEPQFEETPLTVTVLPGQTALLPCRVKHINDKLVSWIRRRDLSILSSGSLLFTGDSRFQLYQPEGDSASWNLQLRNASAKDEGLYECQVNTEPKLKRSVMLGVREVYPSLDVLSLRDDSTAYGRDSAVILGPSERYVREGSTVTLTCHVKISKSNDAPYQRPPRFVDWLFQDTPITSEVRVAGVHVDTEKINSEISSKLTLASLTRQDSGVYSCTSHFTRPATVILIVVDDDRSEAMTGERMVSGSCTLSLLTIPLVTPSLLYLQW